MGTLTIGLAGSGVVNGSKGYNAPDALVTKLVAWGRTRFPVVAPDNRTAAQILVLIFDAQIHSLEVAMTKADNDAALAAVTTAPVTFS